MNIVDLIAISLVMAFGMLWLMPRVRDLGRVEAQVALASFGMHMLASLATTIIAQIVYKGIVDFAAFKLAGDMIATELRTDFVHVAPRAVLLFFHQDAVINVPLNLDAKGGRATVSMWIIAAFGSLFFGGSVQATAVACTVFSFAGKFLMFRTFRTYFPAPSRPFVAGAFLLVPSVVFWTSGLIKEAIAVGALGFAITGFHGLVVLRRPRGLVPLIFGVAVAACIKPYLLMAFGIGAGAWLYSVRAGDAKGEIRIRPKLLLTAVVLGLIGVLAIGKLFPKFAFDTLGEQAAQMQFYGRRSAGGSFYQLGDPSERSLLGQLQFAPIALFTALYRPLIIESSNPQIFVNSLETSGVLFVSIVVFARRGWKWIVTSILSNPALAFSVAFALPLSLGVGLVSNNLGTLSRYRSPAVPFVVLTLAALYQAHTAFAATRVARVPLGRGRIRGESARTSRGATSPALRTSDPGEVPTK